MNEKLNNGYAICPNSWIFDKRIQKMLPLLLLISSLSAKEGYCYASNQYLADKFPTTLETISRQITKLREYGYIETQDDKFGAVVTNRKIRLIALENLNQPPLTKTSTANDESINAVDKSVNGRYQNNQPPIDENVNRINRLNNTSFKNISHDNYKLGKLQAFKGERAQTEERKPQIIEPEILEISVSSFALPKETHFSKLDEGYKKRLQLFIEAKRRDDPGLMSADEFFEALQCKSSYKYLNFAVAYSRWTAKDKKTAPANRGGYSPTANMQRTMQSMREFLEDERIN